jgi:predicted AlkP superfamily pyrophosphatase or phosphodiesterase
MKGKCTLISCLFRFSACAALVAGAANCSLAQTADTSKQPIVIVVSIDGFPARALKDPRLPMPVLRSLAAAGAAATAMRPINPTVTWPNHTAIITGVDASRHFVMANGLIVLPADGGAPKVEPWVDKDKLVHARTLYEAAAEKGLTTGQVDWVAIYGANTREHEVVRWQFGEDPDLHDSIPQELVAQGLVTREELEHYDDHSSPAWRDEIWTDAAVDIIEKHTPNLLLFHMLQTDSIQHEYGPLSAAAFASYAYADHCLGRVVDAARKAGILDRTTFFIVSDHGFANFTHTISPNAALVEQGLIRKEGNAYRGDVWVKAEGGVAELFIRDASRRAELVPKLKAYFAGLPGVAKVYSNAEARALGIPAEAESDQAPQLYLAAAADYAFGDDASGAVESNHPVRGTHGYLNTMPDMQALFVASGAAVKPGVALGSVSNLRVAPTIAKILGVTLPDAKEAPLLEILH